MNTTVNLNEIFRSEFVKFETFIKNNYTNEYRKEHSNITDNLIDHLSILKNKDKWKNYRNVRNILSHNANLICVTEDTVNTFKKEVSNIIKKPSAIEICTKKVYSVDENENLTEVLNTMKENNYTNVPITNDKNEVIGMFNHYTLFLYFNKNSSKIVIEPQKLTIKEFQDLYELDKNQDTVFKFIARDADIDTINNLFEKFKNSSQKLEAILVTESGNAKQKLLGIITIENLIEYLK